MRKFYSFAKLQYFLISSFIFFSVLFPTFALNKILFIFIFLAFFLDKNNTKIQFLFQPFIIFIIFLLGYCISLFNFSNQELSLQFLLSTFVLFLIYPISIYKIDMDKIIKSVGILLSIVTLIFAYFLIVNPTSLISGLFLNIFTNYSAGANAFRNILGNEDIFMFHFGGVPFLFLALSLYSKDMFKNRNIKELFYICLMLFIIVISTSRALFFVSILIIWISSLFYLDKRNRIVLSILFSILCLYFLLNFFVEISHIFSFDEISNKAKKGHIESFFNNLTGLNFMFGNGLASYYFSLGVNGLIAHTEVTILDMMRYFGIIGTLTLYSIILNPNLHLCLRLNKTRTYYMIVMVLYTIMSFTNPTMFNSYGLVVILWYWHKSIL